MNIKTKTQLHFLINLTVMAILMIVLFFVFAPFVNSAEGTAAWSFVSALIVMGVSYSVSTILLSDSKSNPVRMLLPLAIILLVVAAFITVWATWMDSYWMEHFLGRHGWYIGKFWAYLGSFAIIMIFAIVTPVINVFSTKFLMVSLSTDRAEELTISRFADLTLAKANLIHKSNYSMLYSEDKVFVLKFIPESEIERDIYMTATDTIEQSKIVDEMLGLIERVDKELDTKSLGFIVYLSNQTPKTYGDARDNLKVIKHKDLISRFTKFNYHTEESDKINITKLEEMK